MANYKGIEVAQGMPQLLPHMRLVDEYRESLQSLQAVWDNLNLLGHLSGTTTEMSKTRAAFAGLTSDLLNNLASRTLARRVADISAKAQVSIDILVRNLFERTADIGFLATDECIREFAASGRSGDGINARFRAYTEKYSVYFDVVLLSPQGEILDRLLPVDTSPICNDPFIREALSTPAPYVEAYGYSSLFTHRLPSLIYSYRISGQMGAAIGILCLCFDLPDEMRRIFSGLQRPNDWSVICLLDDKNGVIDSSDPYLIPPGARLDARPADGYILRFAGRHYLASQRSAQGYQGYMGPPGWSALVLIPLEYAFSADENQPDQLDANSQNLFATLLNSESAFPAALKRIPQQAEEIQRELERSVWNGNVRQSRVNKAGSNPDFSKILLGEISRTGLRMKSVFASSIGDLQQTVVSSRLDDCRFLARLAIDIMDRNLYERANDCRWWALDPLLCKQLAQPESSERQTRLNQRLSAINDLYTVYDKLVLFDKDGHIVAVSRQSKPELSGKQISEAWASATLTLDNPAHYAVSDFSPTPLYDGQASYIYAAALLGAEGKSIGGIGVVFDSEPQFRAMLKDALPADATAAFGLFVDSSGRIIAATEARFKTGEIIDLPAALLNAASGPEGVSCLLVFEGQVMAAGARLSTGYREYKGAHDPYKNAVIALIFIPMGQYQPGAAPDSRLLRKQEARSDTPATPASQAEQNIEIASFYVGQHWLGLHLKDVVEAVQLTAFTRLPNAPPAVFGSMLYQSNAIPIYNLQGALGLEEIHSDEMQVVVIQRETGKYFGLLVDQLAEITEISSQQIEPVSRIFVGISPVLAAIVKTANASGNMLTILSVDRMLDLLGGFSPANPV